MHGNSKQEPWEGTPADLQQCHASQEYAACFHLGTEEIEYLTITEEREFSEYLTSD